MNVRFSKTIFVMGLFFFMQVSAGIDFFIYSFTSWDSWVNFSTKIVMNNLKDFQYRYNKKYEWLEKNKKIINQNIQKCKTKEKKQKYLDKNYKIINDYVARLHLTDEHLKTITMFQSTDTNGNRKDFKEKFVERNVKRKFLLKKQELQNNQNRFMGYLGLSLLYGLLSVASFSYASKSQDSSMQIAASGFAIGSLFSLKKMYDYSQKTKVIVDSAVENATEYIVSKNLDCLEKINNSKK